MAKRDACGDGQQRRMVEWGRFNGAQARTLSNRAKEPSAELVDRISRYSRQFGI
jgi:hypothetical protein